LTTEAEVVGRPSNRLRSFWKTYSRSKSAVLGLALVLFFTVVAVFGNVIAPGNPLALTNYDLAPPSLKFPFGTDNLGRNLFIDVVHGTSTSLWVGFSAAIISMVLGILIGGLSGYFGGKTENVLMRTTDFFLIIPRFFLAIMIVSIFGGSLFNIIVVIGVTSWPSTARLARAEFLSLREREFVEAARALGAGNFRIMFREILPNAASPLIVNGALSMSGAILIEAGLAFLGLTNSNVVSWGTLLQNAQLYLSVAWWMALFPGLSILLTCWGLNLVGDGLNDALNPRLRDR
jgi:peptide/nickel transport system permease protein